MVVGAWCCSPCCTAAARSGPGPADSPPRPGNATCCPPPGPGNAARCTPPWTGPGNAARCTPLEAGPGSAALPGVLVTCCSLLLVLFWFCSRWHSEIDQSRAKLEMLRLMLIASEWPGTLLWYIMIYLVKPKLFLIFQVMSLLGFNLLSFVGSR